MLAGTQPDEDLEGAKSGFREQAGDFRIWEPGGLGLRDTVLIWDVYRSPARRYERYSKTCHGRTSFRKSG